MGHIERVHMKDRRCETTEIFKSQRQTLLRLGSLTAFPARITNSAVKYRYFTANTTYLQMHTRQAMIQNSISAIMTANSASSIMIQSIPEVVL